MSNQCPEGMERSETIRARWKEKNKSWPEKEGLLDIHWKKEVYDKSPFKITYGKLDEFIEKNLSAYKNDTESKAQVLVVTSPGSYAAALSCLNIPHKCIYVYDSKVDTIDCVEKLKELHKNTQLEQTKRKQQDQEYAKKCETTSEKASPFADYAHNTGELNIENIKVVLAIGGGVAMDVGRFIASHYGAGKSKLFGSIFAKYAGADQEKYAENKAQFTDTVLYSIPTALSVNAAFCYKAALRFNQCQRNAKEDLERYAADATNSASTSAEKNLFDEAVRTALTPDHTGTYQLEYIPKKHPSGLCIDFDILQGISLKDEEIGSQADRIGNEVLRKLTIAGAGDLLSCLTASVDWKINHVNAPAGRKKLFDQAVCDAVEELVDAMEAKLDDIRMGSRAGIQFLCQAYEWIAAHSYDLQHTMWESASEHGMFDYMEVLCKHEFTHGQVIGLSIYFMSYFQERVHSDNTAEATVLAELKTKKHHERATGMLKRLGLDITLDDLANEAYEADGKKITASHLYHCLVKMQKYLTKDMQPPYRYTAIDLIAPTKEDMIAVLDKYYQDFPQAEGKNHENPNYQKKWYR